jgi:hypothetical protein
MAHAKPEGNPCVAPRVVVSSCLSDERSSPYPPHKVGRLIRPEYSTICRSKVECHAFVDTWGQRGSAFGTARSCACQARATRGRSPGRASGIAATGQQDCDLRLLLSGLFRRRRLAKERVDQSLRARQRDHSDAQSGALGTWQHASADNLKDSFACRCYGCTGAGRLFAGKSSRGGFLSRTSLNA